LDAVVKIRNLHKAFGAQTVLAGVDLDLYRGENLVVVGRSGTGKSVLIKCMVGLLEPDAGTIELLGQDVRALDPAGLDRLRTRVGFLFQNSALYDSMTVRENLEFPLRRHRHELGFAEVESRVRGALASVGLEASIDKMPAELSGGMRKRVGLARTIILQPEIILYDEPTTGLDAITGLEIIHLIKQVQQQSHASSIVITHDPKVIELVGDRIVLLLDGTIYADGTYADLRRSQDEKVKPFFH
jgi:phospholipid/cholesterol/gamma-HCH transport system ATP-binding protein